MLTENVSSALLAMVYHTAANTMGGAGFNFFQVFTGADAVRVWWLLAAVNSAVAVVLVLIVGSTLQSRRRSMPAESPAPTGR